MLVGVAERARTGIDERATAQSAQIVAEDTDRAGRGPVEAGEDPEQVLLPEPLGPKTRCPDSTQSRYEYIRTSSIMAPITRANCYDVSCAGN